MSDAETNDTVIPYDWMMECPRGESRSWTDRDGEMMTVDRRPIVIVQDAGAGSEQTINITTASDVIQAPPLTRHNWLNLTIEQLISKAPPHSDTCAFRDYMAMVQTVIHQAGGLLPKG